MNIKLLREAAKIPTRGSKYAAGYDLYAALEKNEGILIQPGECIKIPLGFAAEIPAGFFGAIFPRSGMATKQGLRLANCVGVIDADYRGEWLVPLYNDSNSAHFVQSGDRIAQLVILPHASFEFEESAELSETMRADGGFGSTGRD